MRDLELTMDGLHIAATDSPGSSIVDVFYADYDKAFVLPNEKEPIGGFRACLALNHAPRYPGLAARYGAFQEIVFTASDEKGGEPVGGGNFAIFSHARTGRTAPAQPTIQLNYIFVIPGSRHKGWLDRLLSALKPLAADVLPMPRTPDPVIFLEQNDPLRLTAEAYDEDSALAGLDQVDRIGIWARRGARIVDFEYVQPPLSGDLDADRTLALCVLDDARSDVSACLVRDHLSAFFAISVLKGRDPAGNDAAAQQLRLLESACARNERFALLDPTPWLTKEGALVRQRVVRGPVEGGLRQALKK